MLFAATVFFTTINAFTTSDLGAQLRAGLTTNTIGPLSLGAAAFRNCLPSVAGDTAMQWNVAASSGLQAFVISLPNLAACQANSTSATISCPNIVTACSCTTNPAVSFTSCMFTCVGLDPTMQYAGCLQNLNNVRTTVTGTLNEFNATDVQPTAASVNVTVYIPVVNTVSTTMMAATSSRTNAGIQQGASFLAFVLPVAVAVLLL